MIALFQEDWDVDVAIFDYFITGHSRLSTMPCPCVYVLDLLIL